MTKMRDLHAEWMKDPAYEAEYERLAPEFDLAALFVEARTQAGLTQTELAQQMKTTQSVVSRLESGSQWPSLRTLNKLAQATGMRLKISLEPSLIHPKPTRQKLPYTSPMPEFQA